MNAILLIVSIFMNLLAYGIVRNDMCKKHVANNADLNLFNAAYSLVAMGALLLIGGVSGSLCLPSLFTCALAVIFGLCTALCAEFVLKAFTIGPLSYTNLIVSCAMVIPAFSGAVLYGERISAGQYAGVVMMCLSFACAVQKGNGGGRASVRWFALSLTAFLFSGAVGVLQKLHQHSPNRGELAIFLVLAFAVAAVYSLASSMASRRKEGVSLTLLGAQKRRVFIGYSVICGVGIALCNQINLYLAGVMPSIILYPVINGASMILNTAAGVLLWKEKLSRRQWLGVALGFAAILLLCGLVG